MERNPGTEAGVKKKLVIETCYRCPHYYADYFNNKHTCFLAIQGSEKEIKEYPDTFEWCPLEDAE